MKGKTSVSPKRKALGRGLDALISSRPTTPQPAAEPPGEKVLHVPADSVDPNPNQPRTAFRDETIEELAQSIRSDGLIQPILVRPQGSRYMIVAGERRWRAAKLAGLQEIPAIVREIDDERLLEIALVENIQREELNAIEIALALRRLAQELQLSHEELAQRTGKDRSTITNLLRLLRLPADLQQLVAAGSLSMGHARALLALEEEEAQRRIAQQAVENELSVRQVEQLVKRRLEPKERTAPPELDPNVAAAIEELEMALGSRVRIVHRGGKGRIEIHFSSPDELDRLYSLLTDED